MPTFLHPALFWTLGLPTLAVAAIPVLIHLINLVRHRRVEWAAMEFLEVSHKRNHRSVLFKQLLLMLLRMAAVVAVVLLVAQPRLRSQWGALLGGARTHHIVLLDDSFSMSDRWEDTSAFGEAKKMIERVGADAARQTGLNAFTLLRFSRVGRGDRPAEPDLLKQPVGRDFGDKLGELLGKLEATETAAEPLPAVRAVAQLLGGNDGERRVVYIVSDFRARQWDHPDQLRDELRRLEEAGGEIHLVACTDRARPNLAISALEPSVGIRAAGVPWDMEVAVHNFGRTTARNVSVALAEDGHARPAVNLPEIPPGRAVRERFEVHFADAGLHELTARLESDAVAADNVRYSATDLPAEVPVLLVDGAPDARDARYLSWALAPGGAVRTGIRPQIETTRFLSQTQRPLAAFAAIMLANVERLDASAIHSLEKYVSQGGGLAFFVGDRCRADFYNESLYRRGEGLFPAQLGRPAELRVDRLDPAPDVQAGSHFLFRVFAGKQNSFLQTISVAQYFATPEGWRPPADSTVRVVARLRNGVPWVVERQFGKGRVVAFLSTAGPAWNNWARNPSFVVAMQDLQAYLSRRPADEASRLVGSPLELQLDPALYQPEVRLSAPSDGARATTAANAVAAPDGALGVAFLDTDRSGFYEAQLTRAGGAAENRRYAVNVDWPEGDLAMIDGPGLAPRLEGVAYRYERAASFDAVQAEAAGRNLSDALLLGLVALLVGEQILAWSASYHPNHRRAVGQGGAA